MNATQRKEKIEWLEKEMKRIYSLDLINHVVVSEYNRLEKQWKLLTNHKERKTNPLIGEVPKVSIFQK
jgi:hypothetical protein